MKLRSYSLREVRRIENTDSISLASISLITFTRLMSVLVNFVAVRPSTDVQFEANSSYAPVRNSQFSAFKSISQASALNGLSANPEFTHLVRLIEAGENSSRFTIISLIPEENSRRSCSRGR